MPVSRLAATCRVSPSGRMTGTAGGHPPSASSRLHSAATAAAAAQVPVVSPLRRERRFGLFGKSARDAALLEQDGLRAKLFQQARLILAGAVVAQLCFGKALCLCHAAGAVAVEDAHAAQRVALPQRLQAGDALYAGEHQH